MPFLARAQILSAAVFVAVLTVLLPTPASAGIHTSRAFVSDTNHARVNHDRRAYQVTAHLNDVAQRWAEWMAAHRTLRHNPYLTSEVGHWRSLGENVGAGAGESSIQRAFMNSTEHRSNILSTSFTRVGIGTARGADGQLYVDEVFKRPS